MKNFKGGMEMLKRKKCTRIVWLLIVSVLISILMPASLMAAEPSSNTAATAEQDNELREKLLKSLSFFVGKVTRSYTNEQSSLESVDLSQYIDTEAKTIKSVTGELLWDYDKGIMKIDTPKTQGVTGFLNKQTSIDLGDITIESGNEYATVMVISLDDEPLASSKRILIQAVTEDKFYGAKTENDTIQNLGSYPLNVKNINVKVTFKGKTQIQRVITLDENGYQRSELNLEKDKDGLSVQLAPDALYTVALDTGHKMDENPYPTGTSSYVWWEGESPVETNYTGSSHFDITTEGKWELLSGDNWLTSDGDRAAGQAPLFAKYQVNVPVDGEYDFWVRKFWQHGPFRWSFDGQDWNYVGRDCTLADSVEFRTFICANWVSLGKMNLTAGTHTFTFELTAAEGESNVSGFDCFMLTPDNFVPRGELKPGAKTGLKEEGYFAFEPSTDPFKDAWMDLRSLNEAVAGQSGYVRREGEKFLLGDGTPVKFWAVNATMYQDRETIDYMARRLAKYGVNMVRVHGALFDENNSDLSTVDQDKLDKLHYFVYAMKQQGIYTNISFYFPLWMNVKPEYGIPGYDTIGNKLPFALLEFDEQFQNIYKSWAKGVLLTQNPYTGLPLAQDPAVAIIEVQNEDNYFFWTFGRANIPEVQMNKLETLFGTWLGARYGSLDAALAAWGDGSAQPKDAIAEGRMEIKDAWYMTRDGCGTGAFRKRMSDQLQFLTENQKKFYEDMVSFYKTEIGTRSMVSCSNWTTADPIALDALERYTYTAGDVIDRHGYFECDHKGDGAAYSVRVGHTYKDVSALTNPGSSITQVVQVENYPHMITETAWTNPSKYHGESVPMWSVYGALQGIDAIHLFAVGTADWEAGPTKWPVMIPSVLGQFPAFSLMYRRGDVQEAPQVLKVTHSFADLYDFKGSPVYENQALDILRDGNHPTDPEPPVVPGPDTAMYNFESNDLNGFSKTGGTGTATVTRDTFRKYAGESSMKVSYNGPVTIGLVNDTDIPKGTVLKFRLYAPSDIDADIHFMVFGQNWSYNGTYKPSQWVTKDNWTEYTVEFANGDIPHTATLIDIMPQGKQTGEIWIDSITYDGYQPPVVVEPPAVPGPDTALYNFENGQLQDFRVQWGAGTGTVIADNYRKYAGDWSAKVSYNGEIHLGIAVDVAIPANTKVKYRVYVPSDKEVDLNFMVFGTGWAENDQVYKPSEFIVKGSWQEYEVTFDKASPSAAIVLGIIPKAGSEVGAVWVDSITYDGYGE
jgi:hypothetical protein